MEQTEHGSYEVLVGDEVALGPRYDRLNDQLLNVLCKQIYTTTSTSGVVSRNQRIGRLRALQVQRLTEGLPLLFRAPFSIDNCLLVALCCHFANKYMDGWAGGWMD